MVVDNLSEVQNGLTRWVNVAIGHLVRRGTSPDEAKDIVQQACLTALEKRQQFTAGSNFRSWFFAIVFSRRNDFFRKQTRENAVVSERADANDIVGAIGIDLSDIESDASLAALRSCLQTENPFREAVHLRFFEKLKHKEIAVRLNIPEKTASTRVHRGIKKLKDCIDGRLRV